MMRSFAIYRLPQQGGKEEGIRQDRPYVLMIQHEGQPRSLRSFTELNGRKGFVVVPFAVTTEQPILLIEPDEVRTVERGAWYEHRSEIEESVFGGLQTISISSPSTFSASLGRQRYHIDFSNFHSHLINGEFRKIVLSRCLHEERREEVTPLTLFERACELYPRMFISLVYTPLSGLWLMATPEILLEGSGRQWCTIALAGTMRYREDVKWDIKNIQEQRYVATYLMECLEHFSHQIEEEGPYTTRAANLVHLRSDFNFVLDDVRRIGELIRALHPTPAVCGLPKQLTFDFIRRNESEPRRYYSGFSGPFNPEEETHLYVSLRCMQILEDHYRLYAGGGLLRDSVEEQEWEETEAKLETMKNLFGMQ